ncbi:MAG: hypothetical protein H6509_09420 [Bryobacterales bacterium]|nr:hypothetical protein [Bryobacterales bacterium]
MLCRAPGFAGTVVLSIFFLSSAFAQSAAPVKGPDVKRIGFGDASGEKGSFLQIADKIWRQVSSPDGAQVAVWQEAGRDEWSVALSDAAGRSVSINLWLKKVTLNAGGASSLLGNVLWAKDTLPAPDATGSDPGAIIAPVTGLAVTGANKAVGKTVDTGPGKPVSVGTVCSLLQTASSTAGTVVDKAKEAEARNKLLDQWAELLYETQQQTGVSVANVSTADLLNVMATFESQEPVEEVDPSELVPAGYMVNDPGRTLTAGATSVPVDGEVNPLVIGKLIVFPGVPGSYKIKDHYLGGPGVITIEPGLRAAPVDNIELQTEPEWQSFDIARQVLDIVGVVDPIGVAGVVSAYLHPLCGSKEAERSRGDICWRASQGRGVGTVPVACDPTLPDAQDGLCYEPCPAGMYGVGPVCWTNQQVSMGRGAGFAPNQCPSTHPIQEGGLCYQGCPAGWRAEGTVCYQDCPGGAYRDDGLYCGKITYNRGAGYAIWDKQLCDKEHADVGGCEQKGLIHYPKCKAGFEMTTVNFCQTQGCPAGWEDIGVSCKKPSQGRGVGVVPNGCPSHAPEMQGGLCYPACPQGYHGVGPVCWTDATVSQGRGAGQIPNQCRASHPNFDAGLCYQNCGNPDYTGVGPVCWGGCTGRYSTPCGAGCATSEVACGLAITEMVTAPFEMIASIATLGGYSAIDTLKDSTKLAAKNALKKAAEEGVEVAGKKVGKGLAKGIQKNVDRLTKLAADLATQKAAVKQMLTNAVFTPIQEKITKKGIQAAADRAAKEAAEQAAQELSEKLAKEGLQDATGGAAAKAAQDAAREAAEKRLKEATEKALAATYNAGADVDALVVKKPLTLKEIKDRFYQAASKVSGSANTRAVAMVQECAALGIQLDAQWAGTTP